MPGDSHGERPVTVTFRLPLLSLLTEKRTQAVLFVVSDSLKMPE